LKKLREMIAHTLAKFEIESGETLNFFARFFPAEGVVANVSAPQIAPEPLHVNRRLKAMLQYADGTVEEWRPIEPLQTNWFIDLLWFRHFKFQFSVLTGSDKVLWPPLCEWLVHQAKLDGRQIVSVQLIQLSHGGTVAVGVAVVCDA
jgi:hypothetical protein